MTKILLGIIGFIMAFGIGILVMLFGWGLQPVSWGWIIGGGLTSIFIAVLFQSAK